MGQQGPPSAKKKAFFKNDPGPHGMPKEVFLARFELMENGLFWDKKWVKNGSKMCFSKNDPTPFGVHK